MAAGKAGRKRVEPIPSEWAAFPARLRYAQELRNIDGKTLAAESGVSASSISRILSGRSIEVAAPSVILIAAALRVRAGWLLTGEEPMSGGVVVLRDSGVDEASTRRLVATGDRLRKKHESKD